MQDSRLSNVARISVERSTPAPLDEVLRWLVQHQGTAMRLDSEEVPALGRHSWLRLARPITARRAVLCTLWLVDDVVAGACLLAGHLRVGAHPNRSVGGVNFSRRNAVAMSVRALYRPAQ